MVRLPQALDVMGLLSRYVIPSELTVPFVPLGIDWEAGLAILRKTGANVVEENATEHLFKASVGTATIAIYTHGQGVDSVWYDDPLGRGSRRGRDRKVALHLSRYAPLEGWKVWNEHDWMVYWKHETVSLRMVYGKHMDVIRFNRSE